MPPDRILNINDNDTSRFTLSKMLQHAGFEVVEAQTGREGVERAKETDPALILLDIKLPDIDGFEVCRLLKADPQTSPIPVLHVTAHATGTEKRVQSLEEGADAYLTFPVERTYMIATVRSLIRLRKAEQERTRYLQVLTEKNEELLRTLTALEAERALREKFIATLSHDLRNPLAAIRLASQSARRASDRPEVLNACLGRIDHSAERADQLIQNLLDVGLLRAGQSLPLRREKADLSAIVQDTRDEFASRFHVAIDLTIPAVLEESSVDPQAFRRILENLLQNAVKYGSRERPVAVSLAEEGNSIVLAVQNHGNPVEASHIQKLFDPFMRGDAVQTAGQPGWGLGLTVVRGLVDAHRGSVRVQSSAETGTRFVIEIPLESPNAPGLMLEPDNTQSNGGKRKNGEV